MESESEDGNRVASEGALSLSEGKGGLARGGELEAKTQLNLNSSLQGKR